MAFDSHDMISYNTPDVFSVSVWSNWTREHSRSRETSLTATSASTDFLVNLDNLIFSLCYFQTKVPLYIAFKSMISLFAIVKTKQQCQIYRLKSYMKKYKNKTIILKYLVFFRFWLELLKLTECPLFWFNLKGLKILVFNNYICKNSSLHGSMNWIVAKQKKKKKKYVSWIYSMLCPRLEN